MVYNKSNRNAVKRYNKRHYKHYQLYISKERDSDVVQKLDGVQSKKDYVCSLIRSDIQRTDSIADQFAQLDRVRQITAGARISMNRIIQSMKKKASEADYADRLETEMKELQNAEERLQDVLNALQPVSAGRRYNVHEIAEMLHTGITGLANMAEIDSMHLQDVADGTADMTANDLFLIWKVSQINPSRIAFRREEQQKEN